jgi:predicted GIY-YIG superfamily endonuclease
MHYFTKTNIDAYAPDASGVYTLFNESKETYIGMSTNSVKQRLLSHNNGSDGSCTKAAWFFDFERTATPITRERELLNLFKRKNGRLPKCNEVMP